MFNIGSAVLFMADAYGMPFSSWRNDNGGFHPRWNAFGKGVVVATDSYEPDARCVEHMAKEQIFRTWFSVKQISEDEQARWALANEVYNPRDAAYGPGTGILPVAIWKPLKVPPVEEYSQAARAQYDEAVKELNVLLRRKLNAWPYGFDVLSYCQKGNAVLYWQQKA